MLTTLATAAITLVVVNDFTGKHTDKNKQYLQLEPTNGSTFWIRANKN